MTSIDTPAPEDTPVRRVVYLLGAGATQGTVKYGGSQEKLVMPGLIDRLLAQMRDVFEASFSDHAGIEHLVNDVVDGATDFEHLLTFLADTPSAAYQDFASKLRTVFSDVLQDALAAARAELDDDYSRLYSVLLDMHKVNASGEQLQGFMTLNYDSFLEHAIQESHGEPVNYGVRVEDGAVTPSSVTVLKLHGSFSWRNSWPIEVSDPANAALWIPPGIRKAKGEYPFNAIWGAARELLDCDVLRIIGCNLGANDWDLVSLIFTTMHGQEEGRPYEVEVIGWPDETGQIAGEFPYLGIKSILEIEDVGPPLIAEVLGGGQVEFRDLDAANQKRAIQNARTKISNPFEHWLRLKGEAMYTNLLNIDTHKMFFQDFVEKLA